MPRFGVAYRMAKRIIGSIESKTLRQLVPCVGGLLHHGPAGDRCIHPGREWRRTEQRGDAAAEHGNAQQLSRCYAHCHG